MTSNTVITPVIHKTLPTHCLDRVAVGTEYPGRFSRGGSRRELPFLRPLNYLLHLPFLVLTRLEVDNDISEFGQLSKSETPRAFHEWHLTAFMRRLHIFKHLVARAPVAIRINRQGLVAFPIPPVTSSESYPNSLYIGKPVGIRGNPGKVFVMVVFQPIKLREYSDSADLRYIR